MFDYLNEEFCELGITLEVMLDDILAGIAAAICTIILAVIYHGI